MHCISQRTAEFHALCKQFDHIKSRRCLHPARETIDASFSEAKGCVSGCLLWLHGRLTEISHQVDALVSNSEQAPPIDDEPRSERIQLSAKLSKDLEEVQFFLESPELLRQKFLSGTSNPELSISLFMSVVSKHVPSQGAGATFNTVRTWVAHHRCIFLHLKSTARRLRRCVADCGRGNNRTHPLSTVVQTHAIGLEAVKSKWKNFQSALWDVAMPPVRPEVSHQTIDGNQISLVEPPTKNTTFEDAEDALVSSAMQIVELNSIVQQLVSEQNDSVNSIIEESHANVENIICANEVLESAKKSQLQILRLTYRRMKIVMLFAASFLLATLHSLVK
ncbi:hypothetical protein XU18_5162 [Perkinsela sp. CCAP 1560/4]|nr:hypothetical protein XU18_5162 [Perkinsela sp. CCAP 1560/4]|eukprot:KNH01794.1 hypothetical protein XU18_5162 [Perkinsela sp. CCAP 1560/4]